jgi:hypothetical protein
MVIQPVAHGSARYVWDADSNTVMISGREQRGDTDVAL